MDRDVMDTQQVPASIWQQMIQQNFLSLYDLTPDKIITLNIFRVMILSLSFLMLWSTLSSMM